MKQLVLVPAYGRTYKTVEAARKDWDAGKDFRILNGPYCSIRDLELIYKTYSSVRILANSESHFDI